MATTAEKTYNIIVIGAGWSGINFAKNYLDVYPHNRLILLDSQKTIGGVWAKERIYPGLNIQSSRTIFRFPELDPDSINVPSNKKGFVTSEGHHKYINAYAEKFDLVKRTRLQTTVQHAEKRPGVNNGWDIHIQDLQTGEKSVLYCDQLVVAQGFAPTPNIPDIPHDTFTPLIAHTKNVGDYWNRLSSDEINHVAVYGAGKSAFDVIAALASQRKKVTWIIRGDGRGPGWLLSPFTDKEKKVFADTMASKRMFGVLFPCMYHNDGYGWLHALICRTWLGRWLTNFLFKFAHKDGAKQMGILPDHLKWLEPTVDPLWFYGPAGANNYDNELFDYLRDGTINVIRDTITSLSDRTVHFKSEPSIDVDAFGWGTGYKTRVPIFTETEKYTYGVPTTLTPEQHANWSELNTRAEKFVTDQNPILANPPPHDPSPVDLPRWNLWRLMVSPILAEKGDTSLVFLGQAPSVATGMVSATQSVWAVAYLSGKIRVPEDVEWQTACEMAYIKKRNLGWNDFMMLGMDVLSYSTKLNMDLGMNPFIKGPWWSDLFETYKPADFDGWVDKWAIKEGLKQDRTDSNGGEPENGTISTTNENEAKKVV